MDKYLGKKLGGRYEIQKMIGVGGMSYVYKAYDTIDDRPVAVKILKEEYLHNEEFTRRFKNESKAIAILSHPNIVRVYDVSFDEQLQYIVMEHIDGITLKEYIDQQQDIRWKETVHFTVQILRALQHAHDKGIIHRDIKPQNIMLLPDGTIKVTDFGIARLSRSELRPPVAGEKAIGSVHYISPEQAKGELTDERADLYSIGVMMYEMLTGRLPFEADNAVSVAIMQLQSEAKRPRNINEDIPEGLEEIILKAMQKDAEKRYQSAAEMLSDIDEFKKNPSIRFEYQYFAEEPTRYVDAIARIKNEEEEAEEEEQKEKKSAPIVAILAAVACAIVVIALVFAGIAGFTKLFGGGDAKDTIEVGNFVGKHYANELAIDSEFLSTYSPVFQKAYNADYPEGYVFKQDPEPGSKIKLKDTITLWISTGERTTEIPEVRAGEHYDVVYKKLKDAGFEVKQVEEVSETIEVGHVVRIDPSYPGEAVAGSEIRVFVSIGTEEPDPVKIPDVMNVAVADAKSRLAASGFNNVTEKLVNSTAKEGTVVGISPKVGETVSPLSEITLEVSSGYRDVQIVVPLPDVSSAVDIQVYAPVENGNKWETGKLKEYKGVLPSSIKNLVFTTTAPLESYEVTVNILLPGQKEYFEYARCTVNGKTGDATCDIREIPTVGTTTAATTVATATTTVTTKIDTTVNTAVPTTTQGDGSDIENEVPAEDILGGLGEE